MLKFVFFGHYDVSSTVSEPLIDMQFEPQSDKEKWTERFSIWTFNSYAIWTSKRQGKVNGTIFNQVYDAFWLTAEQNILLQF